MQYYSSPRWAQYASPHLQIPFYGQRTNIIHTCINMESVIVHVLAIADRDQYYNPDLNFRPIPSGVVKSWEKHHPEMNDESRLGRPLSWLP